MADEEAPLTPAQKKARELKLRKPGNMAVASNRLQGDGAATAAAREAAAKKQKEAAAATGTESAAEGDEASAGKETDAATGKPRATEEVFKAPPPKSKEKVVLPKAGKKLLPMYDKHLPPQKEIDRETPYSKQYLNTNQEWRKLCEAEG